MENLRQVFGVFVAGGIGACLRVGLAALLDSRTARLPLGTLAVNLIGCLAIGFATMWLPRGPWRAIVLGGLLGGFTTYSSFALLSVELLRADRFGAAVAQIVLHVLGGVGAVLLGAWLGGAVLGSSPR